MAPLGWWWVYRWLLLGGSDGLEGFDEEGAGFGVAGVEVWIGHAEEEEEVAVDVGCRAGVVHEATAIERLGTVGAGAHVDAAGFLGDPKFVELLDGGVDPEHEVLRL